MSRTTRSMTARALQGITNSCPLTSDLANQIQALHLDDTVGTQQALMNPTSPTLPSHSTTTSTPTPPSHLVTLVNGSPPPLGASESQSGGGHPPCPDLLVNGSPPPLGAADPQSGGGHLPRPDLLVNTPVSPPPLGTTNSQHGGGHLPTTSTALPPPPPSPSVPPPSPPPPSPSLPIRQTLSPQPQSHGNGEGPSNIDPSRRASPQLAWATRHGLKKPSGNPDRTLVNTTLGAPAARVPLCEEEFPPLSPQRTPIPTQPQTDTPPEAFVTPSEQFAGSNPRMVSNKLFRSDDEASSPITGAPQHGVAEGSAPSATVQPLGTSGAVPSTQLPGDNPGDSSDDPSSDEPDGGNPAGGNNPDGDNHGEDDVPDIGNGGNGGNDGGDDPDDEAPNPPDPEGSDHSSDSGHTTDSDSDNDDFVPIMMNIQSGPSWYTPSEDSLLQGGDVKRLRPGWPDSEHSSLTSASL